MTTDRKIRLSYLVLAIMVYTGGFLAFTYQQMPQYFKKDLISYDECTNAVVTANLYRDIFPPRLRLNSLTEEYQGWKEGPDWQHIPPLFLYVPIPFMKADQLITIEVRRLSYVWIAWLQGVIFLTGISLLFREKRSILAALIASWLWLLTPFVRGLLNGNYFGYSDVVLSCSVVLAFLALLLYVFRKRKYEPNHFKAVLLTAFLCTIPLLVKNLLGALPLALLLGHLAFSPDEKHDRFGKLWRAAFLSLIIAALYYGINFWKSPEAFRASFFVSIEHFGDYEGWKRPFHYFLTHYLPRRYLSVMSIPFAIAFLIAAVLAWKHRKEEHFRIAGAFLFYFLLTLAAVSAVTSKSANFLLQGYLFLLFFVTYVLICAAMENIPALKFTRLINRLYDIRLVVASIALVVFGLLVYLNFSEMKELRNTPYKYQTQNERFFQFGERSDDVLYANERSLFILDTDSLTYADSTAFRDPDYWFRYYILFHTGSEARRIEEVRQFRETFDVDARVRARYDKVFFVISEDTPADRYRELQPKMSRIGKYRVARVHPSQYMNYLEPEAAR